MDADAGGRGAGGTAFAALHVPGAPFLLPNCWDVASGLLLADGAPAVGTTSLGITAAAGLADGAGEGRDLTVALAAALVLRLPVPLTVDLEGGFSEDPAEVADLAVQLSELGVAGINLEDGRAGGRLRTADEHAAVVRAVVAAAPALFVNARTDTHWRQVGEQSGRAAETARRLAAYRDAGASGVFAPGLVDLAEVERLAAAVPAPLNVLWHPSATLAQLGAAGVARVSTGSALYRQALGAALGTAQAARDDRPTTAPAVGYDDVQRLLAGGAAGSGSAR